MARGEVRFVFRHFAILGERSLRAAAAAEAAAQQGAFWPYHDKLYEALAAEGPAAYSDERMLAFAQELQLDVPAFTAAWNAPAMAERVQAETREGEGRGVRATPTIFVNERRLEGALPYPIFRTVVEEALQGSR